MSNLLILEDAVLKNKADIEDLKDVQAQASVGITVVGELVSEDNLPDPTTYEGNYGDSYLITPETGSQYLKVFTRPTTETSINHWVTLNLSVVGPQGPAGDEITDITSKGYSTVEYEDRILTYTPVTFTMSDGRTISIKVLAYAQRGKQGEQGIQGIQGVKGDKGDKGDKGEQGVQGEIGPTGVSYHIIGTLDSTSQLPLPTALKDLSGAYLIGTPTHLYVQVGKSLEEAIWTDLGEFTPTGCWEINSEGTVSPIEAAKLVQCNNLSVLNECHLTSPDISGVVNTSAIASSDVLTLKGTNEVEIYQGDDKAIDIVNGKIILSPKNYRIIPAVNQTYSLGDWNLKWNEIITVKTNSWTYSGSYINVDVSILPNKDNTAVIGNSSKIYKEVYGYEFKDATSSFTPTEARTAIDKVNSLYCHNISFYTTVSSQKIAININFTSTDATKYTTLENLRMALDAKNIIQYQCMGVVSNDESGYLDTIYQMINISSPEEDNFDGVEYSYKVPYTEPITDNVYQIK